ncbi:hypothetical protein RJ55_08205 [Drechmeria coniospora]|nr:hypothetical protein RJ55_08205 [Drechmeria coniospora]
MRMGNVPTNHRFRVDDVPLFMPMHRAFPGAREALARTERREHGARTATADATSFPPRRGASQPADETASAAITRRQDPVMVAAIPLWLPPADTCLPIHLETIGSLALPPSPLSLRLLLYLLLLLLHLLLLLLLHLFLLLHLHLPSSGSFPFFTAPQFGSGRDGIDNDNDSESESESEAHTMVRGPSGWRGALAVGLTLLASSPSADAAMPVQFYVEASMAAIQTLNRLFYNVNTGIWDDAWWNSGNALTTLADFTRLRLPEANRLNLGGYMNNTFVQAQKTMVQTSKVVNKMGLPSSTYCIDAHSGCMSKRDFLGKRGFDDFRNDFYDDEGWWALGLIRSFDVTGQRQYLVAAIDVFDDMRTGLNTPCGGIYWSKERKYVNAVANELYLAVATSLAKRIPDNRMYLDIALAQWAWFNGSGMINGENLINDGLDEHCKNNGLQTWSYNQGVILGALAELSTITRDQQYVNRAVTLAMASMKALSNAEGILVETDKCELKPGNCGRDGAQFKGIYVRNLAYLHKVAPRREFADFIIRNADSIWQRDRNRASLGIAWAGPYIKATGQTQSSALDALVAAISVLQ